MPPVQARVRGTALDQTFGNDFPYRDGKLLKLRHVPQRVLLKCNDGSQKIEEVTPADSVAVEEAYEAVHRRLGKLGYKLLLAYVFASFAIPQSCSYVISSYARFPSAPRCQQVGSGGELSAAGWPAPVILLGGLGRELPSWPPRMGLVLTCLGWESPSWLGGTRQALPPRAGARAGSELALAC